MVKYDLKQMLAEVRSEEKTTAKDRQHMTQAEIRQLVAGRRKRKGGKPQ